MPVNVIGTLKPKNNGKFPVAEAVDIKVTEDLRLDEALENKADLTTLNFALGGKADNSDIDNLRAQINETITPVTQDIDNLQSQINEIITPVTQDAEVQNARVGTDGTSYQTLKGRLDAEYDDLTNEQTNLKEDLTNLTISKDVDLSTEQTINGSVAPNGKWYSSVSNKNQSKCVENDEYDKIKITASTSVNAYVSFCKYDSTPVPSDGAVVVFASGETTRHEISVGETEEFNIPSDCTHIVITSRWDSSVDNLPEYVSAKKIIEKVKELKSDIADLKNMSSVIAVDLSTEQTINGSVESNGKWYSSVSNKNQSKCVENDEYWKITVKASASTNAYVSFCKYDSTPIPSDGAVVVFASGETARHEISVGETEEFNIPSDCTHIIIMSRWDSSVDNLPESVQIERDSERIRTLETEISASAINVTHTPQFTDGFYYEIRDHEGGRKIANSDYSCTDYINILGGKSVTVRTYLKSGDFQMGVGFYDIDKKFISGVHIYGTPYYTDPAEETIPIPEKAVYMTYTIVNGSAYKSDSRYIVNQTNSAFGENFRDLLATVAKDIPNYLCSAEKIICIGDSLTAGSYYFADLSSIPTKKTYPLMLSKYTGCPVTNAGMGGKTVKQWMELKRPSLDFSEYDTFIIWLGTNGGLTDTLDTDVLPYESYEDYADTQTGQYCRLIEEINNDTDGDCLIAICNLFASSGDVATTNAVLSDIYDMYVEKGYKMILIDMSDLTQQNIPALHNYIYNNHFGIAGNCYVANRVMKSINTAISNNARLSEYNIEVDSLS